MTKIERAIESAQSRLDTAIYKLERSSGSHFSIEKKLRQIAVAEITLEALHEKAEREKGCVWCKSDGKVTHNGEHFCFFCSYCGKRKEVEHGN